jgi:hypothetical protein
MMLSKKFPIFLTAAFVAFIALVVILGSLQAQHDPEVAEAPTNFTIIASALHNPRGLAFDQEGALFIAEAGMGGEGVCIPGPEGERCYGETGAVTKVSFDSAGNPISQEQVATGFSSLGAKDTGEGATGPNDVAFTANGDMYVLTGFGGDPALRDPGGSLGEDGINFGQLVRVDDEGNWSNELDIAAYETTNNPDGGQVDSNPYALLATNDGFQVVDAGGNDLLNVVLNDNDQPQAATAEISTVAVFPARMVEFPPGSGEMIPMDAVPTAVEMGPDGAYYVSELTGFPYPVGGANIYRVVPGEEPEVFVGGFTNVLDLAWGPDGGLYILEMAKDSLLADPPSPGQIIQVAPNGSRTVIASEGLIAPVDMEFGPDQALYVVNFGPAADMGQVVRIPLPSMTTTIPAAKDNTLYESETGALSNGAGQYLFAGVTEDRNNNLIRRGVLAFDVNAALPEGATVLSATLELNMSRSVTGDKVVTLHPLEKDWGEGDSDASGQEGAGAVAANGDATWLHTFYDMSTWDTAGGDYTAAASASTVVGGIGPYSWSSQQMAADVQAWLDDADANYGWLLLGDESGGASAKRFDSRENSEPANQPSLTVRYIMPLPQSIMYLPVVLTNE